jgi:Protein of unknown function (DUF2808)
MFLKSSQLAIALLAISSYTLIELISQINLRPAQSQTNAGIILFGSIRDKALDYTLDYGRANLIDRYYLTLKPQKYQINEIIITVPETFKGEFDSQQIRVKFNGKEEIPESARWSEKDRTVEVVLKEPIPVDREAVLILSNVRNPYFGGLFQFDARVRSITDIPILRYIGSWVIGID